MRKQDGGPAFPADDVEENGMSLRDYFAAKAMAALLSQMYGPIQGMYDPNDPEQAMTLAHLSYQAADAMLAEREK